MLEKFIRSYSGTYRYTAMIRHQGMVIAFAMDNQRRIFYTVLDLGGNDAAAGAAQKPQSPLDVDAWQSAPTELIFPNEIAEVGFGVADQTMLPVFKKNSTQPEVVGTVLPPGREKEFDYFKSTTARFTEDAPFQVLTDGRYVYIFRQAIKGDVASMVYVDQNGNILVNTNGEKGYVEFDKDASKNIWKPSTGTPTPLVNATLLVDRFLLVDTKLAPKMEVRFQRSRSKTRPASRKDSLGPRDLDGNIFYEPTQELRFIGNLKGGHFSVLLLPTAIVEIQRWQIFAENGVTGRMDSYNVERSADGLFNTRGTQTYTCEDHPRVYAKRAGSCTEANNETRCGKTLIPRIVTQGYAESAMEFDGVDDHIRVEGKPGLNFAEAVTVEAWIKPNQNVKKSGVVVGTAGYSLSINEEGNPVFAVTTEQGESIDASSEIAMVQDTWYHVAGTFDGTAARIFVNGNEAGKEVVSGKLLSADGNLYIGRSSGNPTNPFAGIIDETRLWKRARSSAEMRADMHQRLTGLEPDIVGYWRFDEGSGHVVRDHTNHLLNGTAYYDENRRVYKDIKWTQSDARVGEHPGIERASFAIAGRSFKSAPTSLLYYQQSKAPSGYSGEQKPLKNAGRVMLAVATNNGGDAAKNHIAALDFGVSASGRLAQIPDEVELEPINAEDSNNQSLNEKLDEISGLQTELFSLNNDISRLEESITRISSIISTLNNALNEPASITANIADADFSYLNTNLTTLRDTGIGLEDAKTAKATLDNQLRNARIRFYEHKDYGGLSIFVRLGKYKLVSTVWDNQISAIKVPEGCLQVVVYSGLEFDGDSWTITSDINLVGDSWNDNISSIDVQENPAFAAKRADADGELGTAQANFGAAHILVNTDKENLESRKAQQVSEKTAKETLRTSAQNKLSGLQSGLLNGASATMPRLHTDPLGLTISGGWLGFAWTDDAPLLFDSATGSLALYFRGRDDQFFVAYFDTFTEWARITLLADGRDAASCFSRSTAYEKITMEIEGEEAATCTVSIFHGNSKDEFIIKETWEKVPRSAAEFAKVLNGQASGHTYIGSGRIVDGDLILSSPGGARRAVSAGATLMVGNERITAEQISAGDTIIQFDGSLTSSETLPVFFVEYDYPENASCEGLTSAPDMSNGSVLLRAIPVEKVEMGIGNQVVELAASQVCKWTAAAPGSTLAFDGRTQFAQPDTSVNPEHFDATGDLTLEAWVKPSRVRDKARVIQHHTANSNYALALEKSELMSAMKLDGVNNYTSIPKSNSLNFSGAITIEAWIKPEAIDGTRSIVAHGYPFTGTGELVLRMEGKKYEIGIWHKTRGNILAQFPIPVEDSTGRSWVHLAGVYDENAQKWILYRNGIDVSSTQSMYGAYEIDADWGIGANANPDNKTKDRRIFKGSVDEIRIWKITRTQQEIQSDMNRRLAGNETGLVGYWHFENGEARDYSHYQNNGTLVGNPAVDASPVPAYTAVTGVGEKFVKARGTIPSGNWTHLAAAFDQAYGLQFDGSNTLDCGNDTTLDISQDLTIEAFLMVGAAHDLEGSLAKLHPKAYATLRSLAKSNPIVDDMLKGMRSSVSTIHDLLRTLASLDPGLRALLQDLYNALRVEQVVIRRGVFEDGESDQNVPYSLSLNAANQLVFAFEDVNGGFHAYNSGTVLQAGFYKLAVTRERKKDEQKTGSGETAGVKVTAWDEITFYINGNKDSNSTLPTKVENSQPVDTGSSNKPVIIGKNLSGIISEVRVWNAARAQADIGKNLTGNEKGLVSWWRFQEGSGNKAFDSKGRNHATINSAGWVKSPDPQGSSLKLYVNGQLKETDAIDPAAWMASTPDGQFTLGARKSGGGHGEYFQGEMEEARVWQTTRTEEQIQDNLFLRIQGERVDLVAYYTFDAETGDRISDSSLRGNHLRVIGGANRVLSTAPIGNDTPQVRSALAGIRTPFSGMIESVPAVQEYGDMQFDNQGNLIGVFKRCYSFILDGKWQIVTGYKVGDMVTEWIGQVQFAPQLIGYIEGAPPVPSENLTQPSVELVGDLDDYSEASFIELAEAQETTYTYSATKEGGFDMEVDLGLKLGFKSKTDAGAFVITSVEESKVLVGIRTHFEAAWGWSEEASTGVSRTAGKTTSLELRGRFTTPEETTPEREPFGRRFVPDNVGLALVQSETADVFALRLKHNGALISYQIRANPDIPKDWNIIHFPINPQYVKQGVLDGKIGPIADVDHPNALTYSSDSSYFKPIEAYALKNRIQHEETALETYYAQYAAQDKGRPASMPSESVQELAGFQALAQKLHRNLINTYVWTTDGGLFAETQQTMDVQSETYGGSYDFKWMAGFDLAIAFAIAKVASVFELNALFGGYSHLSVSKSKESKTSFQLNVNLDKVERDIYRRDPENRAIVLLDESDPKRPRPIKYPGKVDAYRFMSFYLEPESDHHEQFYHLVVDPNWLEQSGDPGAVALLEARQPGKEPPCWRVMHRVTYVSRVLPSLDRSAPPSLEKSLQTLDIDSNYELIKQLDPYVRDHRDHFADFSTAVDDALKTYLPELRPHSRQIKEYLSLYYGIEEGYSPEPKAVVGSEAPELEEVPENQAPTVKVGQYPDVLLLTGEMIAWSPDPKKTTVRDDRLEKTEDIFLTWAFLPEPGKGQQAGDVAFDDPHTLETTVRFMEKGQYRLRLTASDGIRSSVAETVITVNQAPLIERVTAGLPTRSTSAGELSWTVDLECEIQTGLGDPSTYGSLEKTWKIISGSEGAEVKIVSTAPKEDNDGVLIVKSQATFLQSGYYRLEFTVSNGIEATYPRDLEIAARVTDGLQVLYTFETKEGPTVDDVSGVVVPLDLFIPNPDSISRIDGGLALQAPTSLLTKAERLVKALKASNALTLEAWIKPTEGNTQGLGRILTLSNGPAKRNFILAQNGSAYHAGLRTTDGPVTDFNASLKSLVGGVTDVNRLAHVVFTRDAEGNAQLFVDGESVSDRTINGDFSKWDENFQLALGNEFNSEGRSESDRAWLGEYHLVAIYDRALSRDEIKQNFEFGADRDLPPQVFAGEDRDINWSVEGVSHTNSDGRLVVQMHGRITHDRPTSGSSEWTKVSGPSDVTFEDALDPQTKAYFSRSGEYKLRLTANDGKQLVSKEATVKITHEVPNVSINITDANLIVTADKADTVTVVDGQASLKLDGAVKNSVGDDYPRGKCDLTWGCDSNAVTFNDNNKINPIVTFHKNGIYKFTLTATNTDEEGKTASASVNITVNQPPVVDAGPDQNLLMSVGDTSITTYLDGTVSDDGLPDPPGILKLKWSVQDGAEDDVAIVSENADFTDVQFKREGEYTLKLEADDSAVRVSDTVKITVINSGMLPDGGRKARVVASGLHVRQEHDKNNKKNILYFLKKGDEVTVIDLWTNPETKAVWGRLRPTEKHAQDPQWSAMKEGDDTFLEFTE